MGSIIAEPVVYCRHPYDYQKIERLPDLQQGDDHADVHHLQNYLKQYGYLTDERPSTRNVLDEPTCDAMKNFQKFFSIEETGVLDQATRDTMAASRCGVPDMHDPLAFNTTPTGWNRRKLAYRFGHLSIQSPIDLEDSKVRREAVRRAFDVWQNAGVGLTFEELTADSSAEPDISVEWRRAADPDHSMVGGVLAHADFPPGFSIITNELPLPLHFDDEEHQWGDGVVVGKYDIQTIAIHEIGHTLGMYHSSVRGSCMFPTVAWNHSLRELQADDIDGIRQLYPPGTGAASTDA